MAYLFLQQRRRKSCRRKALAHLLEGSTQGIDPASGRLGRHLLQESDAGSLFVQGEHDGTFEEQPSLKTQSYLRG
jgi:hypothetical protein